MSTPPLSPEREAQPLAPDHITLVGDPAMGCDAWQWVYSTNNPLTANEIKGVADGSITAPAHYINADKVKQVLAGMLWPISDPIVRDGVAWPDTAEERAARSHNARIHAAATSLGITLAPEKL